MRAKLIEEVEVGECLVFMEGVPPLEVVDVERDQDQVVLRGRGASIYSAAVGATVTVVT